MIASLFRSAAIVLAAANLAAGQPAEPQANPPAAQEPVWLAPAFVLGERAVFEVQTTREKRSGGDTHRSATTSTATAEVVEQDESGWVISWRTDAPALDNPQVPADDARIAAVLKLVGQQPPLQIQIDAAGNMTGLRNWEELQTFGRRAADELAAAVLTDLPPADAQRVKALMLAPYASRETTEALFLKHAGVYFLPFGWQLTPGEPASYDTELPSPFGGDPLPAKVTVSVESVDPDAESITVLYTQVLSPEEMRAYIADLTRRVRLDARAEIEKALTGMSRLDEVRAVYDARTAWLTECDFSVTATNGPEEQIERTRWILKEFTPAPEAD